MARIKLRAKKQYVDVIGDDAYVTRVEHYSRIESKEFAAHVAHDVNMPQGAVNAVINSISTQIKQMLLNGHVIAVEGVGNFRISWNNKTTKTLDEIKKNNPHQRRILYSPGGDIKARLRTAPVEIVID